MKAPAATCWLPTCHQPPRACQCATRQPRREVGDAFGSQLKAREYQASTFHIDQHILQNFASGRSPLLIHNRTMEESRQIQKLCKRDREHTGRLSPTSSIHRLLHGMYCPQNCISDACNRRSVSSQVVLNKPQKSYH